MPDIGAFLQYGVAGFWAALAVFLMWRNNKLGDLLDAERIARNAEATKAATALYEEKVLNVKAESAIEFRDFKIAQLQDQLTACHNQPSSEAAS